MAGIYYSINNLLQEKSLAAVGTNNLVSEYLQIVWVVIALLAGLAISKAIATSLNLRAGGIGGVFAPLLFMGSALGLFSN